MEFFTYRIADVFDRFSSGKNITEEQISDSGQYPVYGGNGLRGYTNTSNFIGECILIGRQGAKCGNVRYFNGEGYMTDHAIVGVCKSNHNTQFMNYALASLNLNRLSGQAAQPGLSVGMLKKQKILLPSLENQTKIANVIFGYNNVIENNNKRIAILEQMAENLYKEWFVRFRFPGHETAKFENGLPEGWEMKRMGNELTIKRGGSPRPIQDYLTDTGLKWLKISDATKSNNPFIFNIEESIKEDGLRKTVYLKSGDLVLSNSATPGLPRILAVGTCIHDGWLYFENQKLSNEFLYLLFNHIRPNLVNKGNGAVFTNLKTDILKKYFFVRPTDSVLMQFDNIIKPIFNQIYTISKQNNNLKKQRDLLLPRLMSGKLEV